MFLKELLPDPPKDIGGLVLSTSFYLCVPSKINYDRYLRSGYDYLNGSWIRGWGLLGVRGQALTKKLTRPEPVQGSG